MLSPYRVLDLTDERGIIAGQILADLGADVIAVEPPGGSAARRRGPFAGDVSDPEGSLFWWAYARNKRSITLDLESRDGRDRLMDLARGADFLIESAGAGEMDRRGLGYEALAAQNPGLIYVSLSPFGQDGPKASYATTDLTILAAAGPLALTGDDDRAPVRLVLPQAWLHAGAEAAGAALIAHFERVGSGRGQHLDVSAQQAAAQASQSMILAHFLGEPDSQRVNGGVKVGPLTVQLIFPAADGHVAIALLFGTAIGPFTRRLMEWVCAEGGCDEATRDKDWISYTALLLGGQEPISEYERLKQVIAAFTATRTKEEMLRESLQRRLLIAPVTTIRDVVESQQLKAREYWRPLGQPGVAGDVRVPGPLVKASCTPIRYRRPAPRLGQHTAEILGEPPRRTATPPGAGKGGGDRLPLDGVKVLDLMWVMAGPATTRVMADYGATIVRVESSKHIEVARTIQPFHGKGPGPENSGLFQNMNAGKLGLALDLGNPAAREVLADLIRWADVLTEAFSPRAMRGWGLTYEAVKSINPRIVMLSTCLMGQTGPLSDYAGFGNLAAAMAGFANLAGWPDRPPAGPFGAYTDYVSPRFSLAALLAALDHQRRTGEGQYLDFSQGEAAIHFLSPAILDYTVNGRVEERNGNFDPHLAPHGVYSSAGLDRWVAIAAQDDAAWLRLAAAMSRDDLAAEASLATLEGRLAAIPRLDQAIEEWTRGRTAEEAEAVLQQAGVAAHGVQNSTECAVDPQLLHRGHFVTLSHPVHGQTTVEGARVRFSRTPAQVERAGPTLGQDNFEVLEKVLGYDAERIAELASAGALE